ncbi:hypothetical protein, conserved [Entamoeba dispar SAW760]|uniref:SprT-like domain-containing protein n=1 Tax=Entamoeba dispar (strain ATCC PRA-260 / SAW760) TaxID=370354 RepID=B0EMR9_ENTDS|nr:uncharacterized protein EDI_305430 [Entamoeba dispar SAW760]EDR24182.1 hypothetical protein, conserved [Entamoeba dispar SAW760]|eukprot:EDR24182.1 hypothetical protein, conserved [Entamoeba dispar SAW760]
MNEVIDVDEYEQAPDFVFYNDPCCFRTTEEIIGVEDFEEGEDELKELNKTKENYFIIETTGFGMFNYDGLQLTEDITYFKIHFKEAVDYIKSIIQLDIIDIQDVFQNINKMIFRGHITNTVIEWSKRMTLCAGICYGKNSGCIIRLSEGILKYRSIQDVVTTIVHESIHAFLFRTKTRDDDSHGVRFHQWMTVINEKTPLHVTVYHTFYEECKNLHKHIWRCTGPCRNKPPFYGYVKRSMNRAPGPTDRWYEQHKKNCDGHFVKIDGPEFHEETLPKKQKRKERKPHNKKEVRSKDLKDMFNEIKKKKQ